MDHPEDEGFDQYNDAFGFHFGSIASVHSTVRNVASIQMSSCIKGLVNRREPYLFASSGLQVGTGGQLSKFGDNQLGIIAGAKE
jgi:hypothetical protein